VSGPLGGEKSASCLRVYSDGKVAYATWQNSLETVGEKGTRRTLRPERIVSAEHTLDGANLWAISSFIESEVVRSLPGKFGPLRRPIDYFEYVLVEIVDSKGRSKKISTREYYVASLREKTKYPAALILLMDKINEIKKEASSKGKPAAIPADCSLKLKGH